jgi:hypothetical protein
LEIDRHDILPRGKVHRLGRCHGHDSHIIDEDVDASVMLEGRLHQPRDLGYVRDVRLHGDDPVHNRGEPVCTPGNEHDPRACLGEGYRQDRAEPGGGAG